MSDVEIGVRYVLGPHSPDLREPSLAPRPRFYGCTFLTEEEHAALDPADRVNTWRVSAVFVGGLRVTEWAPSSSPMEAQIVPWLTVALRSAQRSTLEEAFVRVLGRGGNADALEVLQRMIEALRTSDGE